jgi:hypothetical protein
VERKGAFMIAQSVDRLGFDMSRTIDKAKQDFAQAIFKDVLAPLLKEWTLYLKWGMGGVSFYEPNGDEVDENDPRIRLTIEDIEKVCFQYYFNRQGQCSTMWDVVSELNGEATNDKQELVSYDAPYTTNPPTTEKKLKFKDLKKGSPLYMVDYDTGEIEKVILQEVTVNGELTKVVPLEDYRNGGFYKPFDLNSYHSREQNMFTCRKTAEKSLDRIYNKLRNFFNFPFQVDLEDKLAQVLA